MSARAIAHVTALARRVAGTLGRVPVTPCSLALLALALLLRGITDRPLWLDEGFSIFDATHVKPAVNWNLSYRPIYFLVLHAWLALGDGVAWLRLLSVGAAETVGP